ncbi:serine/threonine protein kinase [Streptomyces sp. PSKA54]|uniref:non-specific serine/threonine protein kinase n=1 Tax=Streptomyces himalayensis subsp. aureolus TaxID=2758039 RepID=A0A7W2HEZ6_9ACTN|nr:serine/threonine-protein kinase [Streptomyces himalayensis]MBA4861448.1 serine/threonine protein kinase [Streptomyces himalayensis subsp. aureolus]
MSEAEQTGNARQDNTARLLAGRYRLGGVLGRGGMGTVWRALDETLGRPVAVKELRFPSNIDQEEKRRLVTRTLREAKAIARIRNTSAVTVYDVVHEDDRPWIVMELVEGKSLAEVIREDGLLTPKRAAEVGLAVLDVLRSAHREGILHRDVKPSNVLIADDGRVVLTDFGIAQVEGDPSITSTGMLVGAPSYISPERARGHKPGPAADLWSLGGLLYASVEGFPPYDKGSAIATLTAVMTEPLEPPKNAGPLEKVIYGLLAKDPEQRLDDAGARALLNDMIHAPEPEPVDATKVVPLPPVPEKRPRRGGSKAGGSKAGGSKAGGTSGGGPASAAAGASAGAASGAASSGGAAAAAGRKAEDAADRLRGALRSLRPARKTAAGSSAASASASAAAPADGTRGTTADAEGTAGRSATGAAGSPGTGTGADSVSGSGVTSGNGADAEAPGTGGSARSAGTGACGGGAEVAEPEAARTTASGATASESDASESDASRTNASAGTASKAAADGAGSGATRAGGAVDAAGAATSGTSGAQGAAGANPTAAHGASGLPATPPPPDTPPHPQPKASLTDVVSRRVLVAVAVVVALAVLGTVLALSLSGGDGAQDSSNGSDKAASSGASADSGEAGKGSGGDAGTDKGSGGDTGSSEDSGSGESAGQGKDLGENSSSGSGNGSDAGTGSRYGAVTTYKHDQGFSIGLPKGWKYVSSDAAGARFTGPDGQKLLVGWTTTPKDDAVRDWENQERYMTRAQYDRIRIEKVGYRGWNAADWEFTYVDGGTKWRSIDRGFVVNSRLGYALMYTAKAADWSSEQRRGTWQTFARTFTPKS